MDGSGGWYTVGRTSSNSPGHQESGSAAAAAGVSWKRRGITRSTGNRRVPVPALVGAAAVLPVGLEPAARGPAAGGRLASVGAHGPPRRAPADADILVVGHGCPPRGAVLFAPHADPDLAVSARRAGAAVRPRTSCDAILVCRASLGRPVVFSLGPRLDARGSLIYRGFKIFVSQSRTKLCN
jgi:hypothetical protein